ncbi:hypothetical protein ACIBIZ_52400 [Nonomuraea spiralis]|uniref:hypothetical protein n=1 Tax=Nonomuraea spiralis TaxID=46182 RepID=UPI00379BA06F
MRRTLLLPAVRAAAEADVILADGFSCRTQLDQNRAAGAGCTWPSYYAPGCTATTVKGVPNSDGLAVLSPRPGRPGCSSRSSPGLQSPSQLPS